MLRRDFLKLIPGFASLSFYDGSIFGMEEKNKNDKACIYIYLSGGISHIDTFTPSINTPSEYRSVKGIVDTGLGFSLAGSFTNLSKHGKDLRVVRSFAHRDANHSTAAGWVNTGFNMLGSAEGGPQKEPAYGSIISKFLGENNAVGVPTYIKTSKIDFGARRDGSAWLGSRHIGFDVDDAGIANLKLNVPRDRSEQRMAMVSVLDRLDDPMARAWTELRYQAYNVAMGKASEAFDLSKESIEQQQKFRLGKSDFGKSLMMAIRTVKHGAKFVTVVNGGWDMHSDIEAGFNSRGEELDWGLSLLLEELKREGLLDKTLVVITTEFGRTPKINQTAGRDHWNSLVPLVFAGGGYNNGIVIGEASKNNETPATKPYSPNDLCCSILCHFGIDPKTKVIDNLQRPRYFVEDSSENLLVL
jgi:hypothetical protein